MTSPQRTTTSPLTIKRSPHSVSSPNLPSILLEQRRKQEQQHIALSKQESLLLSSSGDVVSCRCRNSDYPQQSEELERSNGCYQWQEDTAVLCCDGECDDLTVQMQENSICGPWSRGGLLGGSPAEVASPLINQDGLRGGGPFHGESRETTTRREGTIAHQAQQAFRSPPLSPGRGYDEESLVPIRSFDYSHFTDGGNDMLPEKPATPKTPSTPQQESPERKHAVEEHNMRQAPFPQFVHGIPTFLKCFSQIKIAQVSAHALGSHVLLISHAGLLYSYGLNDHGQLGVGIKTPATGSYKGYIMEPTIVTPLVENGGKAISCAAGVSHSLVVIATEERRITKAYSDDQVTPIARQRSSGSSSSASSSVVSTDSFFHHQMYGFGRNDFNKIGLVSPKIAGAGSKDEMESAVLPRRVALRCKVRLDSAWPDEVVPPQGIFAIAASAEHSAALVRRASGDVELYTWGNAMHGALGLPEPIGMRGLQARKGPAHSSVRVVPVPSFVASLSRTSNPAAQSSSILLNDEGEYPVGISLGRRCSFVVTSLGRCFSFGESDEGMLGLGEGVTERREPSELSLPTESRGESIVAVCAGASHAVATASSGKVFAWGSMLAAGLGPTNGAKTGNGAKKEQLDVAWSPAQVRLPNEPRSKENSMRIVQACAGYDNTVFVADSGRVLSCGTNSGRLGLGELDKDVVRPRTLFGGLHLWRRREREGPVKTKITASTRAKPSLKRGVTLA